MEKAKDRLAPLEIGMYVGQPKVTPDDSLKRSVAYHNTSIHQRLLPREDLPASNQVSAERAEAKFQGQLGGLRLMAAEPAWRKSTLQEGPRKLARKYNLKENFRIGRHAEQELKKNKNIAF